MKLLVILISCLVTFGCAHNQMRFNLAPGSTQDDYNKARIECGGDDGGGGGFIFGPLIIVVPVIAVIESVKFAKRHSIQDCLEGKGFKCIENCAHVSQYLEREKQELERQKTEAERQQMETLKRDQPKPSPPAESETKEVAMGRRPSTSSSNEIKRDGLFIAYNNGTVLDTKTNLMWAAKDNRSDINWVNAKSYCENYRGGGYLDWRMPTQDELAGLYDAGKTRPGACNRSYNIHVATELIDITCLTSWASETRGPEAAYFTFNNGEQRWANQSYGLWNSRALPVRSGK